MRKFILSVVLLLAVGMVACGDAGADDGVEESAEDETEDAAEETEAVEESDDTDEAAEVPTSRDEEISHIVESIIDEDLDNTEISEIKVNENMGLEDGSYIVLPHLIWDVKNKPKTTKEMIEMYSDHLAAKLADEDDISEITVFWEVPYHKEGDNIIKHGYEREGDGMAITEVWHDPILRE